MNRYAIFKRDDNLKAKSWESKIKDFFQSSNYIEDEKNPEVVVVLGGDGTIVEGIMKFMPQNPLFIGLNLGTVGFLASARDQKSFLPSLKKFVAGKYLESERSVIESRLNCSDNLCVYTEPTEPSSGSFLALNDIVIKNLTSVVELDIYLHNRKIQEIRGDGVLVSTSMGSTAYNLSNHGPILMPNIKSFVMTEILDHNVPTPPIVFKSTEEIKIKVKNFRPFDDLVFKKTGESINVGLFVDGRLKAILKVGDEVLVRRAEQSIRLAEFSKNYFFDSVRNKFHFR